MHIACIRIYVEPVWAGACAGTGVHDGIAECMAGDRQSPQCIESLCVWRFVAQHGETNSNDTKASHGYDLCPRLANCIASHDDNVLRVPNRKVHQTTESQEDIRFSLPNCTN